MAYVNVKDWSVDQVTEWLKGLDNVILPYTKSFLNNGVTGDQLLNLRADDLENLGVEIIGHQEVILEGVEHLRNFHYELDKENLQMMALRLSCVANSLFNELKYEDETSRPLATQTMSGVHNIIASVKPLVYWLSRSPFLNDDEYTNIQKQFLQLCFEMAHSAHRDIFSERPITSIRTTCEELAFLADSIIQDLKDPLILQPASLDLTTLRKKEQELGLFLFPSNHSIHQIAEIKPGSPAQLSRKIEKGDEIVQVNYQTVVGWQRKKVVLLLQESLPEVFLTLKKRPQHTKVYGPIYMKPYRLPSKKRSTPYSRWNENLPSPRLLAINDLPEIPLPNSRSDIISPIHELEDNGSISDTDIDPPDTELVEPATLYPPIKSRRGLQRRNTITGASPTSKSYPGIEQFFKMYKHEVSMRSSSYHIQSNDYEDESTLFRDKSASCSHGLELTTRPTTVIGISSQSRNINRQNSTKKTVNDSPSLKKKVTFEENKRVLKDYYNSQLAQEDKPTFLEHIKPVEEKSVSVTSLNSLTGENGSLNYIDEAEDLTDRSNMLTKDVDHLKNKEQNDDCENQMHKREYDKENLLCEELKDVHVHNIIKKFDEKLIKKENNLVINNAVRTRIALQTKLYSISNTIVENKDVKKMEISPPDTNNSVTLKVDNSNLELIEHVTEVQGKETSFGEDIVTYELGIPLIEAKNPLITPLPRSAHKNMSHLSDVPPKPPPRMCNQEKPKYPVNTPKPVIEPLKRNNHQHMTIKENILLDSKKPEQIDQSFNLSGSKLSLNSSSKYSDDVYFKSEEHPLGNESKVVRKFEPKVVSTPLTKMSKNDSLETDSRSNSSSKSGHTMKVSPTNSIVRAMIYSSKGKSGKKRNTLNARKRKVSVNDVSPGDLEGYLYQRFRNRDVQSAYWNKLWFILIGNRLYGFSSKDAMKADVLIYLTGFTACLATEVNSRANAFKVYHTGTVFYFSSESMEDTTAWIENITAATLHSDPSKPPESALYSQSDDSDSEKSKIPNEKTSDGIKKFGSLKKFTSKKNDSTTAHNGSTSLDRKWFFNKSATNKNSVPVPTAQFRSYRKIPSATAVPGESVSTGNFTSHIPNFASRLDMQNFCSSSQNISVPNLSIDVLRNEISPPIIQPSMSKTKPVYFNHASNPSLYNIKDFNTGFFPKPQHQTRENLTGFVTLEELMNRQSEEQKLDVRQQVDSLLNELIQPDVIYGEVPIRPKEKGDKKKSSIPEEKRNESGSFCFGKRSVRKSHLETSKSSISTYPKIKQQDLANNRSLPRTAKFFEPIDSENDLKQYSDSCRSLIRVDDEYLHLNADSELCAYNSDKACQNSSNNYARQEFPEKIDSNTGSFKLKSAMQYTPLSLPLSDDKGKLNPKLAFELNLDEKMHKSGKLKNFFKHNDSGKKEKTLLGSPKLHRAIFRKTSNTESEWTQPVQLPTSHTFPPVIKVKDQNTPPTGTEMHQHPDYPGLEYPPIFEPETYSLSDPQSSLTILRKQQGKNN